jgi:uncharacterized protein (DUF362 family)
VVAGEGEGPLAPRDVPLGAVLAATDPIALDLAAVRLMGFDEQRLPKLCEPMRDTHLRITAVRSPADVEVREVDPSGFGEKQLRLDEIEARRPFAPHPGWRGHVERSAS